MLFDTHTHVNLQGFEKDRNETIQRALNDQTWLINVGTDFNSSKLAVDLAKNYSTGVYAAIGQHPTEKETFDESSFESLLSDKVVAIGECGLDYFHEKDETKRKQQAKEFINQIHFAQKQSLPLIIHCREAYDQLLEIVKSEYEGIGVMHSFTDTWDTAKKFLDAGFYIAVNAILTFDKTGRLAEVVEKIPFDRLLIETDAPFLAPAPYRGKRNEPSYVRFVAEQIAKIKKLSVDEVAGRTFANACELFQIKKPASRD